MSEGSATKRVRRTKAEHYYFADKRELFEAVFARRRTSGGQPWNWTVGLWSPSLPPANSAVRP